MFIIGLRGLQQEYGEEWASPLLAHRLAEAILHRQSETGPYRSTLELADVCSAVKGLGLWFKV